MEPSAKEINMKSNAHDFMEQPHPSAQGLANKQQALLWVYHWGYSTAPVLQSLLRHRGMSWTTGSVQRGWLRKTGMTARERVKVVSLTEKALAWVEHRSNTLLKYNELEPHRISPITIWHNLLAQRLTIQASDDGTIRSFSTERLLSARSAPGTKQPDVVWFTKKGERIAIEVELTAKWDRRFDEFVARVIDALSTGQEGEKPRFDKFAVMTTSKAIATRYSAAFQPGASLKVWRSTTKGTSTVEQVIEVPEWVHQRVAFTLISENGSTISASNPAAKTGASGSEAEPT